MWTEAFHVILHHGGAYCLQHRAKAAANSLRSELSLGNKIATFLLDSKIPSKASLDADVFHCLARQRRNRNHDTGVERLHTELLPS